MYVHIYLHVCVWYSTSDNTQISKWELSLLLIFIFASTIPYMGLEKVSSPTLI